MPLPFRAEKVVVASSALVFIVDSSLALVAVRETTVPLAHAITAIAVVCAGGVFALSALVFINSRSPILFR